jgi:hypothetical protein
VLVAGVENAVVEAADPEVEVDGTGVVEVEVVEVDGTGVVEVEVVEVDGTGVVEVEVVEVDGTGVVGVFGGCGDGGSPVGVEIFSIKSISKLLWCCVNANDGIGL